MPAPVPPGRPDSADVRDVTYTNPVYDGYFADPFVWKVGLDYYAIGTGPGEANGRGQGSVFPTLRSNDLVDWVSMGTALTRPDPRLGTHYWAPEVACHAGHWYLYYSVGHGDLRHQLRVATSDAPLGPYTDVCALTDPDVCPFAIDPHPFRDDDGRWYLFHARDFLESTDDLGRSVEVGTALVVHALQSMTQLAPEGVTVARARYPWQRFAADREMYGRKYDWHTLEGPAVQKRDGRYHCLFSGGCWQSDTYGVDFVTADRVTGPYSDAGTQGPRILRTVPDRVIGPGHCSVVTGPDERTLFLVYHAWDAAMTARRMHIDPLRYSREEGWNCTATWTPQSLIRQAPLQWTG